MPLERVILPNKAVTDRRLIVHYVSRHIIFHDLIPTNKSKGKSILRHKRRARGSCLNSCVAWAITLTERRSARFAFSGTLMPFPSITRNPTGGATVEHLPLINCSSWACIQDFDALREVRERPSGSHQRTLLDCGTIGLPDSDKIKRLLRAALSVYCRHESN